METPKTVIKIHPGDSVAVALRELPSGGAIRVDGAGITLLDTIPPGHKIALRDIKKDERIIKYGYTIGAATRDIKQGSHVHTHNVRTLLNENPEYHYNPSRVKPQGPGPLPAPDIMAFRRKDGNIGIRNEIWIVLTVGCVNRSAEKLARWAHEEFAGKKGSIDGVYAWTHPYGCSQMGDDHETTRIILADLVQHPNAAAVLVMGLGCENNYVDEFKKLFARTDQDRIRYLVTQQSGDEIADGKRLLAELAEFAAPFRREPVKASELIIGMKCGGSDGFSGISANALVGQVCDTITAMGGSAVLTEVPEMFGAEQMLMDRAENEAVFKKIADLINGFKQYYISHNQVVYENPSPGNKEGGITTLEDKSCGCVQKSGSSIVRGVYRYGGRIRAKGLQLLEGPGNDIVSCTAMAAAGVHLILFTTGRGTPLGSPVPTIKIASNSPLAELKPNWIDFDAGRIFTEDPKPVLDDLMQLIFSVASGTKKTRNEINDYREIAIFKDGVTL